MGLVKQTDYFTPIAMVLAGFVGGLMGYSAIDIACAQLGMLLFDWLGKRWIDRWVDKHFPEPAANDH